MADQLSAEQFAAKIRAAHPGAYDDMSDNDLAQRVVTKYPQYQDMVPPNIGLAGPAAPGPVEKVAPTEGPIARALTAGENRIATSAIQGQQQQKQEMGDFLNNRMTVKGELAKNTTPRNPINAVVNPEARERFGSGDIAGGIGEVGANVLPLEIARVAGGGKPVSEMATSENLAAPVRGAVKTGNSVLRNSVVQKAAPYVGAAAGYGLGEVAGLPWYARVGMGSGGAALGKAIKAGDVTIPGERFGLPPEQPPRPLFPQEGGTVSRGTTVGTSGTGTVAPLTTPIVNASTTRPEAVPAPSKFAGGRFEPLGGPQRGTPSGPPASVGKYQPPERVTPQQTTVRTPVRPEPAPTPIESAPAKVSIPDQIATAKGLGFPNLNAAINKFGFEGWQKILGQETTPAEPPSVRPGPPTPFHSEAPLTPSDLMSIKNTRIPSWDEVERQARKEQFYSQAPMVKTKTQLVNEVEPSIVAKSEAKTAPYNRNLPTRRK